ncbi:MAG: hypothetical protein GY896_15625 [Gammaproteobacteria bacterium]|nr:hypothetical protein [Gammaproteobacteria bacterium]
MTDQTEDDPENISYARKFPITSIEKTDPPSGVTEGDWYEYIIGQGSSEIKGKRSGSLKSVTEYVEEYAENLNQRSTLGYSAYAARKPTKQTPKAES